MAAMREGIYAHAKPAYARKSAGAQKCLNPPQRKVREEWREKIINETHNEMLRCASEAEKDVHHRGAQASDARCDICEREKSSAK